MPLNMFGANMAQLASGGQLALISDDDGAGTVYIGLAPVGALTTLAVWQVKKYVTVGGVTTLTFADGDNEFDNVWDNRAALSYA